MMTKVHYMPVGILILLASALPLCAQQTKPPAQAATPAPAASTAPPAVAAPDAQAKPAIAPDTVVLKVGDQQVTAAEMQFLLGGLPPQVQRMVSTQGPRNIGEQYALMLALSQKAVSEHLDQDPEYVRRVKLQERQMLAQAEYKKIGADIKVSPEEISQYFEAHKADFEEADVRQVTVRIRPADSKPGVPGLPKAEARAKAEEIRKALLAGGDPAKLAETYKTPPGAVYIETAARSVRRGTLQGDAEKKVFDLKDGEISEIMENPQSFFFTQMVKHGAAQAGGANEEIESKLREEKLQAAVDNLKTSSNTWLDPAFFSPPAVPPATAPAAPPGAPRLLNPPAATPPAAAPPAAAKPPAAPPSN